MTSSTPPSLPSVAPPPVRFAGFWLRLAASIIDSILLILITWPVLLKIYGMEYFTSEKLIKGPADFFLSYVLPTVLVIIFWTTFRGTPGKLLLGLRVIDARTGGKMDLLQSTIRYLGYLISMLPVCFGFLWIAFDPRKQGFHDKIARTFVIRNG